MKSEMKNLLTLFLYRLLGNTVLLKQEGPPRATSEGMIYIVYESVPTG